MVCLELIGEFWVTFVQGMRCYTRPPFLFSVPYPCSELAWLTLFNFSKTKNPKNQKTETPKNRLHRRVGRFEKWICAGVWGSLCTLGKPWRDAREVKCLPRGGPQHPRAVRATLWSEPGLLAAPPAARARQQNGIQTTLLEVEQGAFAPSRRATPRGPGVRMLPPREAHSLRLPLRRRLMPPTPYNRWRRANRKITVLLGRGVDEAPSSTLLLPGRVAGGSRAKTTSRCTKARRRQ